VSAGPGPAIDAYAARALRRPGELARIWRWVRRHHRTAQIALILILFEVAAVALVAGMFAAAWSSFLPAPTIDHDELHYRDRWRTRATRLADAACDRGAARWAGVGLVVDARAAVGSHAATPSWRSRRCRS
jgi:hypothetical protein